MGKLAFGMKATAVDGSLGSFKIYDSTLGGNYNPYNSVYFDQADNRTVCNEQGRITSIPSPYARMHITDLAFKEASSGSHTGRCVEALSADYNKALSHCLDIFEMLYYSDNIDLRDKKITIEKINLVSTKSLDSEVQELLNANPSLKEYISTLDLFREGYMDVINEKKEKENIPTYSFDFTSLYLFKHEGKVFASTSPFTGFSAKADCDLNHLVINGRKILSSDPQTWCDIKGRGAEFHEFMYMLLKDTKLSGIFENLNKYISDSLDPNTKQNIDQNNVLFGDKSEFRKFNIGANPLQAVANADIFIRPDGLDCSYLKYLLYLDTTVDLTITEDEYKIPLAERRFNGKLTPWYGVNDILADSLFVLTYDINDNYITVPYIDEARDNAARNRCLLPIKRDALNYFGLEDICNRLSIVKKDVQGNPVSTYVVTLRVPLANGGETKLRREYNTTEVEYPNGKVFQGDDMKPFAFGIYPFVKSSEFTNMYKVLFYNKFDNGYSLKFYKKDINDRIVPLLDTETTLNKTNSVQGKEISVNCEYHDIKVEGGIEFAEVEIGDYTSLIVPKLRVIGDANEGADISIVSRHVNIAIDLGTSNTYVAYNVVPITGPGKLDEANIKQISTHHRGNVAWNELMFMNKECTKDELPNALDKNREDLYLRVSDHAAPVDTWLPAQLNEFIPSRIQPDGDNYSFPIPTVINFLRQNCNPVNIVPTEGASAVAYSPLINFSIPFAYYERGVRQCISQNNEPYDTICEGNEFKWYIKKDDNGNVITKDINKAAFKAFLSELLFIVRCHLICSGYDLKMCKLLWSYPLSFSDVLRDEYDAAWKAAFKEYINPYISMAQESDYVKYTNESRTPIYACLKDPGAVDPLTVLLDIGGGSTDVIGYKDRKVQFVTSFGFAGNALYLASSMNSESQNGTLLRKYIDKMSLFKSQTEIKPNGSQMEERKIGPKSSSISTLMNYGFAKARTDFENMFKHNNPAQYMLQLHNAAIIYHVAQMCKSKSPNELPHTIFLSGNGSKQFELNLAKEKMIKSIFAHVYGVSDDVAGKIKISPNNNPKAATVNGALLGLDQGSLATNEASRTSRVVMLGDSSTICEVTVENGGVAVVEDREGYKAAVKENVKEFFKMFYDKIYTTVMPVIEYGDVESIVERFSNNTRLNLPQNGVIVDSFFFQYVALVMEQISYDLASRVK